MRSHQCKSLERAEPLIQDQSGGNVGPTILTICIYRTMTGAISGRASYGGINLPANKVPAVNVLLRRKTIRVLAIDILLASSIPLFFCPDN